MDRELSLLFLPRNLVFADEVLLTQALSSGSITSGMLTESLQQEWKLFFAFAFPSLEVWFFLVWKTITLIFFSCCS